MLATSIVLAVLTAVLAVATILYTAATVRSLNASVRPRFAVDLHFLAPTYAEILVRNVGNGTAVEPKFTLEIRPAGNSGEPLIVKRWDSGLLEPGGVLRFSAADEPEGRLLGIEDLAQRYEGIYLEGSAQDLLGRKVALSAKRTGLESWWDGVEKAGLVFEQDQQAKATRTLEEIAGSLKRLEGHVGRWKR